ncbi:MAG: ABC transporter ATP-binding protein [Campylobacterota bacterium]|nr:ABC transporter ATP-binding protein [Campylobacterota bacterium]
MLKIDNFTNKIISKISFEIDDKNLIILGSNGAGKTTLAKVLSGIISSDEVSINNENPSKIYGKSKTKLINYIPSKLDIFDEFMSVEEFLSLSNLHSSFTIDEVLEILDISYLLNQPCKNLSSGESQLVLLGSAILHNSLYTILDEPTSNLDPKRVKKVFQILNNKRFFKNKIIITHNLDLAYKLGYDILFLEDGEVVFNDTNKTFFDGENLKRFFDNSVKKIENSIVVSL